jgi:hypothetical protein
VDCISTRESWAVLSGVGRFAVSGIESQRMTRVEDVVAITTTFDESIMDCASIGVDEFSLGGVVGRAAKEV